jgi:hypothetical protein
MKNASDFVKDNIESWMDELIAKSRQSRQINLDISERTPHFEIDFKSSKKALSGLLKGVSTKVISVAEFDEFEPDSIPEDVLVDLSGKTYVNASKLNRAAQDSYFDAGLETLYLALGQLKWKRADEKELTSPLAFLPIRIKLSGKSIELSTREDEGIFANIALQMYLKTEHDFELPSFGEQSAEGEAATISSISALEEWIKIVRKAAEEFEWSVPSLGEVVKVPQISVLPFTFTLEAIYRDIKEHEAELAQSELVQSLVAPIGKSINLNGDLSFVDSQTIDSAQPAEDAFDIFMSDSSQRVCIDAARRGMSFVIQGPPGTGKTQTITNIVSNLLHDGKSVLFVADKATALDAVHDKLKQRNLDSFVLRFQDGKVTAKSFSNQLNGILQRSLNVTNEITKPSDSKKSKRVKLREQLNSHAVEGARIHPGFELPVSEVIGLATNSKILPVPEITDATNLIARSKNRDSVLDLWDYAATLATKWQAVEFRETSLWYSLPEPVSYGEMEGNKELLAKAMQALEGIFLGELLSIEQIQTLMDFKSASLNECFPAIAGDLTLNELYSQRESISNLDSSYRRRDQLVGRFTNLDPIELPKLLESDPFKTLQASVSNVADGDVKLSDLNFQLTQLQQVATYLQNVIELRDQAAQAVGLREVESWADIRTISEMHISGAKKVRPSVQWFHPRRLNVADLQRVIDRLEPVVEAAANSESRLLEVFPTVNEIPDLALSKDSLSKGNSWLGRLSSVYKVAFKAINEASYIEVSQIQIMDMVAAYENRKLNLGRLNALTQQLPELSEYRLEQVFEYVDLLSALKESRTALTDVNNSQNALLNATPDSSLFFGNALSSMDEGINTFVASVERLFELQATNIHLKNLLGKTTISNSNLEVNRELNLFRQIRDTVICISRFASASDLNDVAQITEELVEIQSLENAIYTQQELLSECGLANISKGELETLAILLSKSYAISKLLGHVSVRKISNFLSAKEDELKFLSAGLVAGQNLVTKIEVLSEESTLVDVESRLKEMLSDKASYNLWCDHLEIAANAGRYDAEEILNLAKTRQLQSDLLVAFFKAVLAKIVLDNEIMTSETFSAEFASGLDSKVGEFATLDEDAYESAAKAVFAKVTARAIGTNVETQATIKDRSKNTRLRIPIRIQLAKLGQEALEIAPVVMASPINVSKYVPDTLKFDYVIFDEASQLYPAFALASLYRANKAIIAGDEKQMPPPKVIGGISIDLDDEDYSEDSVRSSDYESLLDFAGRSSSFPEARLLWHYRSRNESLIAFSNHEFYKGDLFTFPSQFEGGQSRAVRLELVKEGVWYKTSSDGKLGSTGPAGTNPIEAARVAEDVRLHAHNYCDENHQAFGKSLMVIATGKKQAEKIEELVNKAALLDEVLAEFLANQDPKSRFTVKNLETAQGDERDYVFLSFAYNQRNENNPEKVMPFFGPLVDQKGWRRLNVAITRARYQMVLYASCRASNIEASTNESVNHIRNFFNYAEIGYPALQLTKVGTSSGFSESPFEEEVVNYITSLGYECTSQVGSAGYRLDIGVKHKDYPDVYMLGVECDGYMYHSSAVARDRDRIRQEILEGLGWTFHRIWGTRWYRYNENEKIRLKEILESQSRLKPKGILVAKE